MKQIDEILNNLATSIESVVYQSQEQKDIYIMEILDLYTANNNDRLFVTSNRITTLGLRFLTFLLDLSLRQEFNMRFICKGRKYILNTEKLIFELVEEELKPCIWCEGYMLIFERISQNNYSAKCQNCEAIGPRYKSKLEAVRNHNEIYQKTHGKGNCDGSN